VFGATHLVGYAGTTDREGWARVRRRIVVATFVRLDEENALLAEADVIADNTEVQFLVFVL
jgi:hypothetical protein